MTPNIIDITQENAQEYLIDQSFIQPVLVDFWSDQSEPCLSLMLVLDNLAAEYSGRFLLAKVNVDEQPMIVSQFGVQSLPTIMVMQNGQPVDGFTGAQSETDIRILLDKYLPKSWDLQLAEGKALLESEDYTQAVGLLKEAYETSSQRGDIACTLADAYIGLKRLDDASAILANIRMADQSQEYHQLLAKVELAKNAEKAPEISNLEEQLRQNPNDEDIQYLLAIQYSQHQYHQESLTILFTLLQKDLNCRNGEVRQIFSDVIAVLGKGDSLAAEYQRKLYSLLY